MNQFGDIPAGMTEDDFTEVVLTGGPYDGRVTKLEDPARTIRYGNSVYHITDVDEQERPVYQYDETA